MRNLEYFEAVAGIVTEIINECNVDCQALIDDMKLNSKRFNYVADHVPWHVDREVEELEQSTIVEPGTHVIYEVQYTPDGITFYIGIPVDDDTTMDLTRIFITKAMMPDFIKWFESLDRVLTVIEG